MLPSNAVLAFSNVSPQPAASNPAVFCFWSELTAKLLSLGLAVIAQRHCPFFPLCLTAGVDHPRLNPERALAIHATARPRCFTEPHPLCRLTPTNL